MTAHRRRAADHAVRACFSVREAPGITVTVSRDGTGLGTTARHTAQRVLAEAGRGYLGGRVELRTPRPPAQVTSRPSAFGTRRRRAVRRAADRAVALAVAATLRGDAAGVRVHVRTSL
ncbi:hypothetical protein [Streptomyces vietnamensis]|uniref:hypothetical protein n=1 Tax=Streptomyces vietnamensis TaxID=362257 RepID=UPI000695EAE5|nr:hypothetical protein [Streptomyces vietnamensis]